MEQNEPSLLELSATQFTYGSRERSVLDFLSWTQISSLAKKFPHLSSPLLIIYLRELLRFFYLVAHTDSLVFFVGNKQMDSIWHALIVETKSYQELCHLVRPNSFFHHRSLTFNTHVEEKGSDAVHSEQASWLASYIKNFGHIVPESFQVLSLAQSMADVMGCSLEGLNQFGDHLIKEAESRPLEIFDFDDYLETKLKDDSNAVDQNPELLHEHLCHIVKGLQSSIPTGLVSLNLSQLENLFSHSTALAFTLWQHLGAIERVSGFTDWQEQYPEFWSKIARGDALCGLATTHILKPGPADITATEDLEGFLVSGTANWICGYHIFDYVLLAFRTSDSMVFAFVEAPKNHEKDIQRGIFADVHSLLAMNGMATYKMELKNHRIPHERVLNRTSSQATAKIRPSKFVAPEIGIVKRVVSELQKIASLSSHPKITFVSKALNELRTRLDIFLEVRRENPNIETLIPTRDELIRDSIRLLALSSGAQCLSKNSLVARLHAESLLMDLVLQPHTCLETKILSCGRGKSV